MNYKSLILALCLVAAAPGVTSCSLRQAADVPVVGAANYSLTSFTYETTNPDLSPAERQKAALDLENAIKATCKDIEGKDLDPFGKVALDGCITPYTGKNYRPYKIDVTVTCYKGGMAVGKYEKKKSEN